MPMRAELYPVNWREIATAIKDANDWQCQSCGMQCRRPGEQFDTHRRTLTVAHIWPDDHAPDAPAVCVAAMCSGCHLRFDVPRKVAKRLSKGEMAEMYALYPPMPDLQDGRDIFADKYGEPTGKSEGLDNTD